MSTITLDRTELKDKILGCWLGKNIGGTLGTPYECLKHAHALTFYDPVPSEPLPNDDLDLQLVWLKMLEEEGVDPSVRQFAAYWKRYAERYPWNEYGFFMRNYSRGLVPPIAGCFENYFVDEMGSPIRSEIWACLHPADPQAAARMAWKDSAVDHAGGEGTYGEMFWAAVGAAAFVESDPLTLIRIGLSMIPYSSHIARAIREVMWCKDQGLNWGRARQRIVERFAQFQPCNAIGNHAFTVIGWLYGEDYGDALCKAVNCGYDTDCSGATLGATLGIILGAKGLPQKWIDPIGRSIKLHKFTSDCGAPADVDELTERTLALTEQATAAKSEIAIGSGTSLPADLLTRLSRNRLALESLRQDYQSAIELVDGNEVWLHYGGEPVLRPGIGKEVWVTVGGAPAEASLTVPAGWSCTALGGGRFQLLSAGPVAARNELTVTVGGKSATFAILGPDEAQGYGAGNNVKSCPGCHARIEACMCPKA